VGYGFFALNATTSSCRIALRTGALVRTAQDSAHRVARPLERKCDEKVFAVLPTAVITIAFWMITTCLWPSESVVIGLLHLFQKYFQ
jgi:hypothetical protein